MGVMEERAVAWTRGWERVPWLLVSPMTWHDTGCLPSQWHAGSGTTAKVAPAVPHVSTRSEVSGSTAGIVAAKCPVFAEADLGFGTPCLAQEEISPETSPRLACPALCCTPYTCTALAVVRGSSLCPLATAVMLLCSCEVAGRVSSAQCCCRPSPWRGGVLASSTGDACLAPPAAAWPCAPAVDRVVPWGGFIMWTRMKVCFEADSIDCF